MRRMEITDSHLEAIGDIFINDLIDSKDIAVHTVPTIQKLIGTTDSSKAISFALQKSGLNNADAASALAMALTKSKTISVVTLKKEE